MNIAKSIRKSFQKWLKYVSEHAEDFSISPSFFTRARKWTLLSLLKAMFSLTASTLQKELYSFTSKLHIDPCISTSSFIQQRKKLKLDAFQYIFFHVLSDLTKATKMKDFHGYYILACDGSDFPMPTEIIPSDSNATVQRKVQHHLLHVNAFYDVMNGLHVAVSMEPKLECNERSALLSLVETLAMNPMVYTKDKTIITCDRGYEGRNVFFKLLQSGYHFVIRAKDLNGHGVLHNAAIPLPTNGELVDTNISIKARKGSDGVYRSINQSNRESGPVEEITLRVVVVPISEGKFEYLITNVPREKLSSAQIVTIYRRRWDIEVSFRYLKYSVNGIVFHAKNLNAQQMELYTALTLYNCISTIALNQTNIPRHAKGYRRKINFSAIVHPCIDYILFNAKIDILRYISKQVVFVKEGRSFERKMKKKGPIGYQYRFW